MRSCEWILIQYVLIRKGDITQTHTEGKPYEGTGEEGHLQAKMKGPQKKPTLSQF